jgi:hypothetical protein
MALIFFRFRVLVRAAAVLALEAAFLSAVVVAIAFRLLWAVHLRSPLKRDRHCRFGVRTFFALRRAHIVDNSEAFPFGGDFC